MVFWKFVMNGCVEFCRYDISIILFKWKGFVIEKFLFILKIILKIIFVCMYLLNLYDWDLNVINKF